MARIRSIHPDACKSRKLAAVSADAERVYWRLHPHCDDEGRAEDEPDVLASLMFQTRRDVTAEMVDEWLWELAEAGLIERYAAAGGFFVQILKWGDYQHPQRPKKSTIPAGQSAGSRTATRRVRDGSSPDPRGVASGVEWSGEGEQHARAVADDEPAGARWAEPSNVTSLPADGRGRVLGERAARLAGESA